MRSKLTLSAFLLVACSGSIEAIDGSAPPATASPGLAEGVVPPPSDVEARFSAPDDADAAADADASEPGAGRQDAALEAKAPTPTPRFGVTTNGDPATCVATLTPSSVNGQAGVTFEAWHRLNATSDRGAIFTTPYAYCAVTTGGPATIHCCAHQASVNLCVVSPIVANPGAWHHVAWVLGSGSWTLFVDGARQGDVPSPFVAHPSVLAAPQPYIVLGADRVLTDQSSASTIDEFRATWSTLYTEDFSPVKHLDPVGAVNLPLDEGVGATSGPATLYGSASWTLVSR